MAQPDISLLIPAHNEGARTANTILSIAHSRTTGARLEFVIVDDGSTDDSAAQLAARVPQLLEQKYIDVKVCRCEENGGNYEARNEAARHATAPILFITDAHVEFCDGWDELVFENFRPNRILAGTTTQKGAAFRGYGCQLLIPLMDTWWNKRLAGETAPVQIAACSATVISADLFRQLGGYDTGMLFYGGGEPEFSVRAWLEGAEVHAVRALEVRHEFRTGEQLTSFMQRIRPYRLHNSIRFGLLYLSEAGCLQLLRYFALTAGQHFPRALNLIARSDVFERRAQLEKRRERTFPWFLDYFGIRNQIGDAVL